MSTFEEDRINEKRTEAILDYFKLLYMDLILRDLFL